VSTDGGSLPEVVGDSGIVVPHSNPPALAEAIDTLLKDPARREKMSVKARQHILDSFKWERCARDVVALYRRTLAAHHGISL
jgi:glycosyltransferase involved in cell wall biosynthesis